MKFVLFHGAFGSPEGNWFPELKDKLESLGQDVIVPNFPVESWDKITKNGPTVPPKHQSLMNWFKAFEPIVETFYKEDKLCFIGHSLGPVFILHAVERFNIQLDSAIFVCPFLEKLNRSWQIDLVNKTFYKTDFNFDSLKQRIPRSTVLYGNNDPYVNEKYSIEFANKMGSTLIKIQNGGHLNSEFGYVSFPLIVDLCKKFINHT